MSISRDDLFKDLGQEPSDRGVPLAEPVEVENLKPDVKKELSGLEEPRETEELQEERAEVPEDTPEEVSETDEETIGEDQAEGPHVKLRAKDFADQAGWTLEEFYRDVTIPTDEGEVTLSEVVDGYKSLREQNEILQNERQELEAKASQQQTAPMQQYAPKAVKLMQEAEQLQQQFDAIQADGTLDNMNADESIKLDRKYRYEIDRRVKAAREEQTEYQKQVDAQMEEYLGQVNKQLRKDIPEWRSKKIQKEETEAIATYLESEGMDKRNVDDILKMNPLATRMFRKLWQYERSQADTKKALKEIRKVPKSLSPGARQEAKPNSSLKDLGKKLQSVRSRGQWDKTLMETEFD